MTTDTTTTQEVTTDTERGLTTAEVQERVAEGKVNHLPSRSGRSTLDIVRANVFTRVNLILFVLFVIVMTTGAWLQGAFGVLIIANSVIGMVQELRAKKTLDNLAIIGEAKPAVVRDGQTHEVPREEVVEGDLVLLRPGDQVVVDGRVVAADYLEVDESMLTGEADPVTKQPGDEVLSGAFVVTGTGRYVAEKVGAESYAAKITAQASRFTLVKSELRQGIDKILGIISILLVPVGLLTIWVQFHQPDSTWQESVLRMTAALVPMVPEGLVLLTSMAFALGVIRLGRRKCLVNELPAIEGLARVNIVCADKTGTLTENAMTLGELEVVGELSEDEVREVLQQLGAADPAPNSSMQAIVKAVGDPATAWPVKTMAPFTSAKKWSGCSFGDDHGDWVLGAPDILATGDLAERAQQIADTGRRVLLLARASGDVAAPDAPGQVQPCAFLLLDQLVRPDAGQTLRYFGEQGVKVKIISGDNAASVGAVTRSLGVDVGKVMDARKLPSDNEELFGDDVVDHDVFGRVTPVQKREMVEVLQQRGNNVAMTGDGVNDVLALKDADLGVAMGSGSPATRAVAQIVLLDDRFATLPHVVAEGRRVIGNVERVAKLFLTKTVYAVGLALAVGLMGLPNPFLPLQMTIVGWFTIGIPAFLLSLAPNKERARPGFVPRVLAVGVPCGLIVAAAATLTYVLTRGFGNVSDEVQAQASTATLAALIITASWVLATVSRPWVLWRIGLVVFGYLFYAAVFLLPWAQGVLGLDISNRGFMTTGVVAGLVGVALVELVWWATAAIRREPAKVFRG